MYRDAWELKGYGCEISSNLSVAILRDNVLFHLGYSENLYSSGFPRYIKGT